MSREETIDNDGCVVVLRAKPNRLEQTNVRLDLNLSSHEYKSVTQNELQRISFIAPWCKYTWITQWRSAVAGLYLLMSDHLNCRRFAGRSKFHYSCINPHQIRIATPIIATTWGIEVGEPYFLFPDILALGLKGDDSPMKNWPKQCTSITMMILSAFVWKDGILAHSRLSSILTLISGEGCHADLVRERVLFQCKQLSECKQIIVWCQREACWGLIRVDFSFGADWPFESAIYGLLGHSSNAFLHGVTRWCNGEPTAIRYNLTDLYAMFIATVPDNNLNVNFNEWRNNVNSGYTLTTTEIYHYMYEHRFQPELVAKQLASFNAGRARYWDDHKYNQTKRRQIAIQQNVFVVDDPIYDVQYRVGTEWFHAFDTYMHHLLLTSILDAYCIFDFHVNDTQSIVDEMS